MKILPALRKAATEDRMTSSGTALIPLTLLSDPAEWSRERRRDALLIGDPGVDGGWGDVADIPAASPFMNRHAAGCLCCTRDPVAMVLAQVFQDRVVGRRPFFREVAVLTGVGDLVAVRQQLENDVLVRARYRLVPGRVFQIGSMLLGDFGITGRHDD